MSEIFIPREGQPEVMQRIRENKRCALWMPMGGGKTVSTLTMLDHLNLVEDVFPALVLAPLRVARTVWGPEVQKWAHLNHLRVSVITGSAKERDAALDVKADIYCINYDNLVWLIDSYGDKWPFKTVVSDEATRLKSFRLRQGSKRARALGNVAWKYVTRFVELTGTPSPNGLRDLWGQIWFLDEGLRLGRTFTAFSMRWFRASHDGYGLKPMDHTQKEIEGKLKDICFTIHGMKVDEPIYNDIEVILPPDVMGTYKDMEKQMFAMIANEGITAANAAVRTGKCLQIANGAIYHDEDEDDPKAKKRWSEVHDVKLDALESVIEDANGAPVLVAYNFRPDLARILKRFPKARVLDTNPQTVLDWNAGKIEILVAHPASAGHGLNLAEGGNIIVFFGVNWNLEEHQQIIERIGPMRQKQAGLDRAVYVYLILARGTVDYLVRERLLSKKSAQEILMNAMRARKRAA